MGAGKADNSTIKKELTVAEQMKLQKDLAQTDKIIAGYQDEQAKNDAKVRDLTGQLKVKDKEVDLLKKQLHD